MKETKKYFLKSRIRSEQWGGWHQINFTKGMASLSETAFYNSRGKTYIYIYTWDLEVSLKNGKEARQ